MELGELIIVKARDKWPNEARDFTPWLAKNIDELSKAIGLELEVENIEVAAGPYSADILAKDTGTGKYVVIENQLGKTDHDHLGKVITYAAVLDASTIIWIATEFTEQHKKAIDWLNDHTNDEIAIYGIQVELWKIDNSNPAVRLNSISKPNEAVRQATKTKNHEELNENRKTQLDFWLKFREMLAATKKVPSLHTPRPQYWYNVSLGKSNIHLSNTCSSDLSKISIRVYIRNQIASSMLPFLLHHREEIEKEIGIPLTWNPNADNIDKVILLSRSIDFTDTKNVDEALKWMVEYTIKMRNVFSRIIKEYRFIEA